MIRYPFDYYSYFKSLIRTLCISRVGMYLVRKPSTDVENEKGEIKNSNNNLNLLGTGVPYCRP
jgi:hypothetical protein